MSGSGPHEHVVDKAGWLPGPADEQFERELAELLNRHGLDASVEIPDYILARALYRAIPVFGEVWEAIKDHAGLLVVEESIREAVDAGLVEVVEGGPDVQ